jgi:hypothetical protein
MNGNWIRSSTICIAILHLLSGCEQGPDDESASDAGASLPDSTQCPLTDPRCSQEPQAPSAQAPSAQADNPGTPDTSVPDLPTISAAEDTIASADFSFEASLQIHADGLIGDGTTDNTATFVKLLGDGNRTIYVPKGDYATGPLFIPGRTILILEPGTVIRDLGRLRDTDRVLTILSEDVQIHGLGSSVVADRGSYTSGEQRHGVFIYGAHRVLIDGLESTGHSGDGFYIGGRPGLPATDVMLKGVRSENDRRQGLSITSGRRIRVVDSEFSNTNGTAPEFGIDLEPNHPNDFLDDVILLRPNTRANLGGGIMIYLEHIDTSTYPVSVTIVGHSSEQEQPHLETTVPYGPQITLKYGTL